jgi:hypothetical protein
MEGARKNNRNMTEVEYKKRKKKRRRWSRR